MNKWMIFVVVLLLSLMVGLQYVLKNNEVKKTARVDQGVSSQETADALPAPQLPEGAGSVPDGFTPLPPPVNNAKATEVEEWKPMKICEGGSMEEILAGEGKTWGYSVKNDGDESLGIDMNMLYKPLSEYYSCLAAAKASPGVCRSLPNTLSPRGEANYSARKQCETEYSGIALVAFMAGRANKSACQSFAAANDVPNADSFCSHASKGPGEICSAFSGESRKRCQQMFSGSESGCGGRKSCLDNLKLYSAFVSGDTQRCPASPELGDACKAFLVKSPSVCSTLANAVSTLYCSDIQALTQIRKNRSHQGEVQRGMSVSEAQ